MVIVSLVVVCLLAHTQALSAQPVSAGFKAGVTAARLPGVTDAVDATVDEESRWGGTAGVFVTLPLNDHFAFQPEALYVVKGATLVGRAAGSSQTLSFDARYLETPLFVRFRGSSRRIYFLAGPYLGFRLAAEARETINGVTETRDFSDQAKRMDAGISFGTGVMFDRFLVELRWTKGLRDLESGDRFATAVRHRAIAVLAGIRF